MNARWFDYARGGVTRFNVLPLGQRLGNELLTVSLGTGFGAENGV